MALKLPKGTQFGFAPVVSTAIATSAISKAAPALASVAANSNRGDFIALVGDTLGQTGDGRDGTARRDHRTALPHSRRA